MKLVTAIMPTRGRAHWAAKALISFQQQTYPNKELVILDDEEDPSFQWPVGWLPGVRYATVEGRPNIPAKRNALCEMANGEIIIHWDSDDLSANDRIADQVQRLEESGKAVTGYNSILFHEPSTDIWGRWRIPPYAFGTSLCYLKSWWADHRFNEGQSIGEDNEFVHWANQEGQVITVPGEHMIVARAHPGNTSPKDMGNCGPVERSSIPAWYSA